MQTVYGPFKIPVSAHDVRGGDTQSVSDEEVGRWKFAKSGNHDVNEQPNEEDSTVEIITHVLLSPMMCFYQILVYSCGCTTPGPFKQCPPQLGTNVRCTRLGPRQRQPVGNYCPRHLVTRGARIVYARPGGHWQPVADNGGQGGQGGSGDEAEAEEDEAEEEEEEEEKEDYESDNNRDPDWHP
ncbi:hypothetical protein ASPTUDRAFT_27828 [Aspergillus tubingensis CBS 134.48]|uniref:Uncharacterized protein n=1 Tax=Aspergillus tubingensis (strain CBS 134.48) TaxID=767770 RepID=A0A1L9NCI7_ASPTC|nr:hypothetical protein ASPTUDRAFT_27828 [Aspergillus tubingensis CBS 134.48]